MINNTGPSTLPCGVPLVTLLHMDFALFTTTLWWRSDRKSSIQARTFLVTLYPSSFLSSLLCGTLSNAFMKSMNTVSTQPPSSSIRVQTSRVDSSWVVVDRPAQKPCCCWQTSWFCSMCVTSESRMRVSISLQTTELSLLVSNYKASCDCLSWKSARRGRISTAWAAAPYLVTSWRG